MAPPECELATTDSGRVTEKVTTSFIIHYLGWHVGKPKEILHNISSNRIERRAKSTSYAGQAAINKLEEPRPPACRDTPIGQGHRWRCPCPTLTVPEFQSSQDYTRHSGVLLGCARPLAYASTQCRRKSTLSQSITAFDLHSEGGAPTTTPLASAVGRPPIRSARKIASASIPRLFHFVKLTAALGYWM
jgi:hypothetical protein